VIDHTGQPLPQPGDMQTLSQMAACCALCNDSTLSYAPEKAFVPPSPRALTASAPAANVGQACTCIIEAFACTFKRCLTETEA